MAHIKRIEFGNYTLKFGEDKVLLDMFDEVVWPSFHEMKYTRKLKNKGEYFFLDTKIIKFDDEGHDPVIGITGRIVKNTQITREQIFRTDGGIIEDKSELETAPSSIFILVLNNHRLSLCKEVPGAPSIQNFQATSQNFLRRRHREYINDIYKSAEKSQLEVPLIDRITKKSLALINPSPELRITPLSDKQDLKGFIDRFRHIDEISIKLLPTNKEEIDNDDFWTDLGRRREDMNSNAATVRFSNTKEGLDSESVYAQTSAASQLGNSSVNFKGSDDEGDTIRGNNDDFNLSVEFETMPKDIDRAAAIQYNSFMQLVKTGAIALPQLAQESLVKIKTIIDRL